MTEREKLISDLDSADFFLRNRVNAKPAPLNEYDKEALLDIAEIAYKAARMLEKAIVTPCKVGDMVYVIEPCNCYNNYSEFDKCHHRRTKATKWIEMVRVPTKHYTRCVKLFERPIVSVIVVSAVCFVFSYPMPYVLKNNCTIHTVKLCNMYVEIMCFSHCLYHLIHLQFCVGLMLVLLLLW